MTNVVFVAQARRALRHAAARARLAPSLHNSQPWRFRIEGDLLEMELDRERRLGTIDPRGRQALISCGCALFNARAALAAADVACIIERFPEGEHTSLFARLQAVPGYSAEPDRRELADLDPVIDLRATNRTRFESDVPPALLDRLAAAALAEGAGLVTVHRPEHRLAVAILTQRADALQNADPAYRAELRAWTTDDPGRLDGVPAFAVLTWTATPATKSRCATSTPGARAGCRPRPPPAGGRRWWCWAPTAMIQCPGCAPAKRWNACCWRSRVSGTPPAR
jgi:hypothetical protein